PAPDTFLRLPAADQLLASLAHLDWAGFHTATHAENFQQVLAGAPRVPRTGVHPLGIDRRAVQTHARARAARRRPDSGGLLVLSVERLDYAKAPVQKVRALTALLAQEPD